MKTTKEKADELILNLLPNNHDLQDFRHAKKCAILSVKHTIEVLEKAKQKAITESEEKYFNTLINEQTELLTELESRL